MTNKTLYLDADGVLLDYTREFLKHTGRKQTYEEVKQYSLAPLFDGGLPEMLVAMEKFHNSHAFSELPALIPANQLDRLLARGWTLKVITQLDGMYPRALRSANLEERFPDIFAEIIFTSRGQSKLELLLDREKGPIYVVEDNPAFFKEAGSYLGFHPYAIYPIVHPYNEKEFAGLGVEPVYGSLSEVVDLLCG